jgi:hypothetical protein
MMNLYNAGMGIYRSKVGVNVPDPTGGAFRTRLADLPNVTIDTDGDELVLRVPGSKARAGFAVAPPVPWYRYDRGETRELRGEAAIRAAGAILPRMNQGGGSQVQVQRAVSMLEQSSSAQQLFLCEARALPTRGNTWTRPLIQQNKYQLKRMPTVARLALEMAAHEEAERRALEGELHILETAWREAEEIAGIADDMFVPASVEEELARLKRDRDAGGGAP